LPLNNNDIRSGNENMFMFTSNTQNFESQSSSSTSSQSQIDSSSNTPPSDLIEGFGHGLADLSKGITKAVTGIVKEPINGVRREGVKGFLKGVTKGVGGVVLHPVHGVLNLIHHTSEGIMTLSGISFSYILPPQVRYPRYFGSSCAITAYNIHAAKVNYIFRLLNISLNGNEEYIHHRFVINTFDSYIIIITTERVFCVKSNMGDDTHIGNYRILSNVDTGCKNEAFGAKLFTSVPKGQSYELKWEVKISDIKEIKLKTHPRQINFILHGEKKSTFVSLFFDYIGLPASSVSSTAVVQTADGNRTSIIKSPILQTPFNDESAVLDVKNVIDSLIK
jgi:hypothetical protein